MSQNVLLIDRETAHHCLKETGGDVKEAHKIIAGAGVKVSLQEFRAYIKKDKILSVVWGSTWKYDPEESPAIVIRQPIDDKALDRRRFNAEQDYIAARGFEGTGMEETDIRTILSMAQVAQTSMGLTVDATHTMMIEAINELRKEGLRIRKEILLNTEKCKRHMINKDGELLEYEGDKYTAEEKADYTKAWMGIQDSIRKMAETAHKSVHVRALVMKIENDVDGGGVGTGDKQRPKRVKEQK